MASSSPPPPPPLHAAHPQDEMHPAKRQKTGSRADSVSNAADAPRPHCSTLTHSSLLQVHLLLVTSRTR